MRIKKTSQYIEGGANLSNVYGTSNSDGYTQSYINGTVLYETTLTTSTGFYTGTETISEDIKNFKYIDVWAKQKGGNARCMIFRYFVCNNQIFRGNIFISATSGTPPTNFSFRTAILEITGTTASISDNYNVSMTTSNITTSADGITIVKIMGYK